MEQRRNESPNLVSPSPLSQRNNGEEHRKNQPDNMDVLKYSMKYLPEDSALLKILKSSNAENGVISLRDILLAAAIDINSKDQQATKLGRAKDRVVGNLKAKKVEIRSLQSNLSHVQMETKKLGAELTTLRQEHEILNTSHSSLKTKIHHMQGTAKESHAASQVVAQRLAREKKLRSLEQAVLEQFRELGRHTGYAKCGKAIRIAEGNLSLALEQDK